MKVSNKHFDESLIIENFFSGSLEDSYQTSTTPTTIISFTVIIVTRSDAGNFNEKNLEQTQNSKISDTKFGPSA